MRKIKTEKGKKGVYFNIMLFLILFAFLAGVVTILSPCILPVLPIVLSGSVGGGKRKPLGIVLGFIASFTFFTLALSTIVKATGLSADYLRIISVLIIFLFGVSLLLPSFQLFLEGLFSKFANLVPQGQNNNSGFIAGVLIGLSLGLVWTPCVGPIIASVITLAATSQVNLGTVIITLAYSVGTAIPMLLVMQGGRAAFEKVPWLLPNTEKIQKGFGVLMILTALGIFFNLDRRFQTFILDKFPQYGAGLTAIEDNPAVRTQLGQSTEGGAGAAPEFIAGGEWFNTQPLKLSELKGKVVLVDFWTYTCINCIRTLPYLKDWYNKYHDKGLVIVGVQTPEFEFEKNSENVSKAIKDFGILYPVMQDNDYATWKSYDNHYWPAEYLIDSKGMIRHTHFGEGEYDQTEKAIQDLLKEAGQQVNTQISAPKEDEFGQLTPETYLGSERMELYFPSGNIGKTAGNFDLREDLSVNSFSLGGSWTITDDHIVPQVSSQLLLNFRASKVYLVMRPPEGKPGRVRVYLDNKVLLGTEAGEDVEDGVVTVDKDRLYNLVKLEKPGVHILKLEFLDQGTMVYVFTYG